MIKPLAKNKYSGFTLIELMIAMVIVAILTSIALPAYQNQVARTQRTDAKISLLGAAQQLETCFTATGDYSNDQCSGAASPFPITSDDGFYTITVVTPNANTYTLTATPVAGGPRAHDAGCATFIVDQTSDQTVTGTHAAEPEVCWN